MKDGDDLDAFTTIDALKTRLAVSDVGRMAVRGASREELLARYPDLRDQDIELAKRIASDARDLSRDAETEIDATRFRLHPALIPKVRDWDFD